MNRCTLPRKIKGASLRRQLHQCLEKILREDKAAVQRVEIFPGRMRMIPLSFHTPMTNIMPPYALYSIPISVSSSRPWF